MILLLKRLGNDFTIKKSFGNNFNIKEAGK